MMDFKRVDNLKRLSNFPDIDSLLENIKSEIDYDMHCAVGLGNRMPVPETINGNYEKASQMKNQIYNRVVEIWQDNQD